MSRKSNTAQPQHLWIISHLVFQRGLLESVGETIMALQTDTKQTLHRHCNYADSHIRVSQSFLCH